MVKVNRDGLPPTPLDELKFICNKIIGEDVRIIKVKSKKRFGDYSVLIENLSLDKIKELEKEPIIDGMEYKNIFLNIKLDYICYISGDSYLLSRYLYGI